MYFGFLIIFLFPLLPISFALIAPMTILLFFF